MPIYEVEANGKTYEIDAPSPEALQRALGQTFEQRVEARKATNPSEYMPQSKEYQAKYGPLSDSNTQNFRAGAGKAFMDIYRGGKQLVTDTPRAEIDESRRLDSALMNTKAGKFGNLAGNVAAAAPTAFIPGANTYLGSALIGGGMGFIQPVGTEDSRLFNTGLGSVMGVTGKYGTDKLAGFLRGGTQQGANAATNASVNVGPGQVGTQTTVSIAPQMRGSGGGYTFGSVGDDAAAGLTAAQKEILKRGQAMGMRTTPGQSTGSRALQQFEAKLESQPMTSGPFNTIKANNAQTLNRAAAHAIGESADTVDSAVLDRAFTRIGGVFDEAADDVARPIDPGQFLKKYTQVQQEIDGLVQGFGDHPLVAQLTKMAETGSATGKQLQSLTSKLGKASYKQMTTQAGDRDLGMALGSLKDYVDDLLQVGMKPERATKFMEARKQWRNLMMLTSRVGVVNPSTGNVSGRMLANVLQQKDKSGFLRGRNQSPMYDAARFSQAFAPIVGDSGTATRMPLNGLFDFATRIPANIATRAYLSSPSVSAATGAQAAANAVRPGLQRTIGPVSPYLQRYLPPALSLITPQAVAE